MDLEKKTKIVCTIGPASEKEEVLEKLIMAGMNVARLNFSHATFDEHQKRVDSIRAVMKKTGKTVAIMQDLCGPKIRVGDIENGMIMLETGQTFVLTTDDIVGTKDRVKVSYRDLPKEIKKGDTILLQDGARKLEVTGVEGNDISTKVLIGGRLSSHNGVNVPNAKLSIASLTEKDKKDIEFGVKNKVDFVALSFVRKAEDVRGLRSIIEKTGSSSHIIAKIETPEAIKNIDEIIEAADGIMVARGDLGIEIPAEEVPLMQKMIIHKCNSLGKPVITATQMLESMIKNPTATRAEISDVANAIIDGTDAIMLSEETAMGDYPVEAVTEMTKTALHIEEEVFTRDTIAEYETSHGTTDVVSQSAVRTAHSVGARFIVALTRSGDTARMIARYRPAERIIVLSDDEGGINKLMLVYGCYPMIVPTLRSSDEIMDIVRKIAFDNDLAKKGDMVVVVAGMPFGDVKETNFILTEKL